MAMKMEHSRWIRHWLLTAGVIAVLAYSGDLWLRTLV